MFKFLAWALGVILSLFIVSIALLLIPGNTIENHENRYNIHNLHLMDQDPNSGFKLYRLGKPSKEDIKNLCLLGVEEIAVLSGTAKKVESEYKQECPSLKVVYNVEQDVQEPLTTDFIKGFDRWVSESKRKGKKIAFRCNSGSHRTGRLAAYYQMKYRKLSTEDAWDLAQTRGIFMHLVDRYGHLQEQFIALNEFVNNKPCSQSKYCVVQQIKEKSCSKPLDGCGWLN